MNKLAAFLKKDFRIDFSYKTTFFLQLGTTFISVAAFYFLSRFVGNHLQSEMAPYGGNYFAFLLIGLAANEFMSKCVEVFSRNVREAQLNGTLESLVSTATPLHRIILYSGAYPVIWSGVTVIFYFAFGIALFGFRFAPSSWFAATLILLMGVIVFVGLGIISASFVMVLKRGSPITFIVNESAWLLGGVLYPTAVLPGWLQTISGLLPITYIVNGMRAALLDGGGGREALRNLGMLGLFASMILPVALLTFHYATRSVRVSGTLGHH
jgi:ABC-2 type transport system permease protein